MTKKRKRYHKPRHRAGADEQYSIMLNQTKSGRGSSKRPWIEACPESSCGRNLPTSSCFVVTISRVELLDDLLLGVSTNIPTLNTTIGTNPGFVEDNGGSHFCTTDIAASPPSDPGLESAKRRRTVNTVAPSDEGTSSIKPTPSQSADHREPSDLQVPALICVQRDPSALKPRSYLPHNPDYKLLPNGDCGDGIVNPHVDVEDKYWAQRRRLFSRFDHGIELDSESWYSVTPEAIAQHIAQRMVRGTSTHNEMVILDPFGGAGGNTVALCQRPEVKLVVCVDINLSRLRMAANNCRIYGIPSNKVAFVRANAVTVLESYANGLLLPSPQSKFQRAEAKSAHGYCFGSVALLPQQIHAIFLSPPWGGPELVESAGSQEYDLEYIKVECSDQVVNGESLLTMACQALPLPKNVAFFLPRNTNGKKVAMSAIQSGFRGGMELEGNFLNCKLKTVTAYFH